MLECSFYLIFKPYTGFNLRQCFIYNLQEFLSSNMDETMKQFQKKLTDVELEAEHLLSARHQVTTSLTQENQTYCAMSPTTSNSLLLSTKTIRVCLGSVFISSVSCFQGFGKEIVRTENKNRK